jgi:hypothetical protein
LKAATGAPEVDLVLVTTAVRVSPKADQVKEKTVQQATEQLAAEAADFLKQETQTAQVTAATV